MNINNYYAVRFPYPARKRNRNERSIRIYYSVLCIKSQLSISISYLEVPLYVCTSTMIRSLSRNIMPIYTGPSMPIPWSLIPEVIVLYIAFVMR